MSRLDRDPPDCWPRPPSPSPPPPSFHLLPDITKKVNFGEDIDFVVGVTATALTADQLLKVTNKKNKHKVGHLAKAGLSAAVAATAFSMMEREHREHKVDRLQHPDYRIKRRRSCSPERRMQVHFCDDERLPGLREGTRRVRLQTRSQSPVQYEYYRRVSTTGAAEPLAWGR
ncbi:hypothetical protein B0T17DRAFT_620652 [Bombardia bombarda]|uniref:Uncharacterized protein n=1 Tax=Bombardia bombarda TaxID=252184 RepID=A0AA39TPK5_9PEZI|nr:hypothetical protein B0T17DRAFT_620652 [Bombardia bombarda]